MSELKGCDQCGFEAEIYQDIDKRYCISCSNGNCSTRPLLRRVNLQEAIEAWNTRADGWISVEDEPPSIGQDVLILLEVGGNIERGKYIGDGDFKANWCNRRGKNECYKVTHWMPLPSLPTTK